MSVEFFLDTNVLVYTFDALNPEKRKRATQLVEEALATQKGAISYQVIQELLNVATRKFASPFTPEQARRYLGDVLEPLCAVYASSELFRRAVDLKGRLQFGFYDSLIVAAALQAGCQTLYTEDLQHRQTVESLTIVDPFR
jgi:predicted nucleic acid-binding protein